MKIFTCEFMAESSTFATGLTDFARQTQLRWLEDEDMFVRLKGGTDYVSGFMKIAEAEGVELIPSFATLNAGPRMSSEAFEYFTGRMLEGIRRHKDEVAGLALALHGGGASEQYDDLEGEVLRRVRELVGEDMPIAIAHDLHSNMTKEMHERATLWVSCKEYPHSDCHVAGEVAMDLLLRTIRGTIRPVTAFRRIPMLFMSTTQTGPAAEIRDLVKKYAEEEGLLDASFLQGFPFADTAHTSASIYVIADGDKILADRAASELAEKIWTYRQKLQQDLPSPAEGIELAMSVGRGPVVINETSDNPGAGTPGDGTRLLRALLAKNCERSCMGFIYDPEIVEAAVEAGPGTTISGKLGGKTDAVHGDPVDLKDAYVKSITDGTFAASSPMMRNQKVSFGKSVRLVIGNVDVIVCSVRSQTFDDQIFLLHGIDFMTYRIVGLKSSNHFRAFFADKARKIITVDSPGCSTLHFSFLHYEKIPRPMYPLDQDASFHIEE
jgi:microcystin degradation protein MlrC